MPEIAVDPALADATPGLQLTFDAASGKLVVAGRMTVAHAALAEAMLESEIAGHEGPIVIDLAALDRIDTVGAWLLYRLMRDRPDTRLEGANDQTSDLIEQVKSADTPCEIRVKEQPFITRELDRLGNYVIEFWRASVSLLSFIGLTIISAWRAIRSGRWVRWNAIGVQMEQTGVNALGIVGLMSFLIGIVLAQQGATQLRSFGAEVFVINLVGRATFRELGILLTAIMVAGRSASAFAAQIGSMKLAEEVDAMRTIGLDPIEILVLPRTIALIVMLPLLSFYASILAVTGGGLFTWLALDIPPATFVQRLREVVPITDFWVGLSKAPVFGALIGIIGCHQGFQVSGNAESVGQRTTRAVVEAIFLVIVLDAFFAVFYSILGFN